MNNYIAILFTTILLSPLVLGFGLNVSNEHLIDSSSVIIEAAKEQAKQEGYFTDNIIKQMKDSFESIGIESDELDIEVTTTPKYRLNEYDRRELIEYSIGVPVKHIIAANRFFGIDDQDNQYIHFFKGQIASEKLPI